MNKNWLYFLVFFIVIGALWYTTIYFGRSFISTGEPVVEEGFALKPGIKNRQYWEVNRKPVMLLGGSVEDNLFQIEGLEEHLDLLVSAGGNYVRNTMSSRDEGNVWPFAKNEDGLYDLNQWDPVYWERFSLFLRLTSERKIAVQIELWATFDYYRDPWSENPFNPKNNINYTTERVKLPVEIASHPTWTENPFFWSVPSQHNNLKLMEFQQKFIDKLLSYTLQYDHVLYCMDNETSVTADWGKFWSLYIKKSAALQGKKIYTTEMWDPWDLNHAIHRETFDHPAIYDFVDISQNNHKAGDEHWNNGLQVISRLKAMGYLRPVNNVKVYGNDGGAHHSTHHGIEAFVQNVLLGSASSRFHRPTSGQGLNQRAQKTIRSMRSLVVKTDFFNGIPANELLSQRESGEAFCRAVAGKEYVVYFPSGGKVSLNLLRTNLNIEIEWLDILEAEWRMPEKITVSGSGIELQSPDNKHWLALIKIK